MTGIQTQSQRVGVVVNTRDAWRDALRHELREQLLEIGLPPDEVELVEIARGDPLDGLAAILYLHRPGPLTDETWLEGFVEAELCIPVVESLTHAWLLPGPVSQMNAVAIATATGGTDRADHVVRELLTLLLLRRRSRKVFLSYRRTDSQAVANALLSELAHARYQAFLDTAALQVGVQFQKRLMEWLYDADLVVVLGSPRMSESNWVQREIQAARQGQVGLVVVRWPQECFDAWQAGRGGRASGAPNVWDPMKLVDPDQLEQLELADFVRGTADADDALTPAALARVIQKIESKRLLAILERTGSLISRLQFPAPGAAAPVPVQGSLGDFRHADTVTRALTCYRVFPFRPDVEALHDFANDTVGERPDRLLALHYDVDDDATAPIRWLSTSPRTLGPADLRLVRWVDDPQPGAAP